MKPKVFQKLLLKWYAAHKRDLPWRHSRDPYAILVSEVMLQQTQVQTVIPYYQRWLKTFPTFKALSRAPLDKVLKAWEGLGYYSRARNLHALAGHVAKEHGGKLPSTHESLHALPGIGRYTAGAVLSIAFGKPFAVVDGNVLRVLSRVYAIRKNIKAPAVQKEFWTLAETLLSPQSPGDYNQALMELGATICVPRNPLCTKCPLKKVCQAYALKIQNELPIKQKQAPTPHFHIGAGVIWHEGLILISQRPLNGLLGGLWEFPGGKQEAGETLMQTVQREIKEELDINVRVREKVAEVDHAYSHFKITLHAHHCDYVSGEPKTLGVRAWRWVRPAELKRYAFPAANQPVIDRLTRKAKVLGMALGIAMMASLSYSTTFPLDAREACQIVLSTTRVVAGTAAWTSSSMTPDACSVSISGSSTTLPTQELLSRELQANGWRLRSVGPLDATNGYEVQFLKDPYICQLGPGSMWIVGEFYLGSSTPGPPGPELLQLHCQRK